MNRNIPNAFMIVVLTMGLLSVSRPERALAGRLDQAPPPPPIPTEVPGRVPSASSSSDVSVTAISPVTNPKQLAVAMGIAPTSIVSASLHGSDVRGVGVGTAHLGHFFPTQGTTFAILSTGKAADADTPNNSGSLSYQLNGVKKGVDGHDMTQLQLSLKVPAWANCANVDFAFYSEEFPEYVGSSFNDAFTAEKGGTNLTFDSVNHKVVAPLNFAFDSHHNIISVNTVFGVVANTGTTYDGGTPLLRAETKVVPGSITKFVFSIQDLGDNVWDSTVFLDKFVWSHSTTCTGGGEIVYYTLSAQSSGAQDGTVRESGHTTNVGGFMDSASTTFNVGDDSAKRQYEGILSFNTAPLPDTARIVSAMLRIKKQGDAGTPWLTLGNILADIRKGSFGLPALQLTDFQALASRNAVLAFTNTPLAGGWYAKSLSAANRVYINRVGLTQFRLRFALGDDGDSIADYLRFYSGNALAAYQPQLIIRYYVP